MKSMKKHNAYMASIPSKRNDPYAAAAAEVDSPGFLLTTVEKLAGLAQARSMWPVTMGLACCAIEMMAAGTPASTWPASAGRSSAPPRATPTS